MPNKLVLAGKLHACENILGPTYEDGLTVLERLLSRLAYALRRRCVQPDYSGRQMEKIEATSVSLRLKTTLSKLYPIEHWAMSTRADAGYPFAPRFCWEFFRADPETLRRLSEAIRNYSGGVSWVFGPPSAGATCLVAAELGRGQFVGYPSIDGYPPVNGPMEPLTLPTEEFIDKALIDIRSLCSHLERDLGLEQLAAKSFDPRLIAPHDPPSVDIAPFDFVERGMHVAWIIHGGATESGAGKQASPRARQLLHFSVTAEEWRRIEAGLLDKDSQPNGVARPSWLLLTKIQETESAYFRGTEVESLRQECLAVRASASTPLAIRGLDKLILLCNWAHHKAGDLFLRAP
jgi:hypothetical protein